MPASCFTIEQGSRGAEFGLKSVVRAHALSRGEGFGFCVGVVFAGGEQCPGVGFFLSILLPRLFLTLGV